MENSSIKQTVHTAVVTILLSALSLYCASTVRADQQQDSVTCLGQTPLHLAELNSAGSDNHCPRANAGPDQKFVLQQVADLNASASSNIDGNRLSYRWSVLSAPSDSAIKIANPASPKTHFTADAPGEYEFAVTVTDSFGHSSTDRVRFSTSGVAPIARAGGDVSAMLGDHVTFGSVHTDTALNQNPLSYSWRVLERPPSSTSALYLEHSAHPSLYIDAEGDYLIELIVRDHKQQSSTDTVRISTINTIPVADAGTARTLAPGATLLLDGSQSNDFDDDQLSYHWSLLSAPDDSQIEMRGADQPQPVLKVDQPGFYVFQLIVDDGEYLSTPSTVLIDVKRETLTQVSPGAFRQSASFGGGDDGDGDGVINAADNCVLVANPAQRDTDNDGIGNFCDPDFNNDGIVNFADFSFWAGQFLTNHADADLNGDGTVNFGDAVILNQYFLKPPGPVGTIVWVSLVDGDWTQRENWFPQIIPTEHSTAIIDVETNVTVTLSQANASVFNLAQNEHLVLSSATFTAVGAVGLGGTLTSSASTIYDTTFMPSSAGTGNLVLNPGTHTWHNNVVQVPALLKQGGVIRSTNGLIIDDVLTINAPTGVTGIQFMNDQTLGGNGEIVFNSAGNFITNPQVFPQPGTTLTIGEGLTVRGGKATIGSSTSQLILHGTLHAEGQLMLVLGQNISGTGTWRATNGGEIRLSGNIDNNGDAFNLDSSSGLFNFVSNTTVSNTGFIGQPGSAVSFLPFNDIVFENVSLSADINTLSGGSFRVNGNLELNGNMTISESLRFFGSGTLSGSGEIILEGGSLFSVGSSSEKFTIGNSFSIRGWGYVGSSSMAVEFKGPIIADVPNSRLVLDGNPWSLESNLVSTNGGRFGLTGPHSDNGASLDLDALADVHIYSRFDALGTPINCTSGTYLDFRTGNSRIESASVDCNLVFSDETEATLQSVTVNGDAEFLDGANPELRIVTVNGNMNFADGGLAQINGDLALNGTATIEATDQSTGMEFPLGQRIDGNATIILDGPAANPSYAQIHALGTLSVLRIGPQVTIRGSNGRVRNSNGKIFLDGTITADLGQISVSAAEVKNDGVLEAKNGHTLSLENFNPGTGLLNVSATSLIDINVSTGLTFSAANSIAIDIAGATFAGQIHTNNSVNYNGALSINVVNGYVPNVLDSFSLFSHAAAEGNFSNIISNGLSGGQSFDVSIGASDVTATVVEE